MLLSKFDENNLTGKDIDKILFDIPSDDKLRGDCIWVFGSIKWIEERVQLAVKLFNEKRVPYILFSGGLGKGGTVAEATIMKERAMELGVPEKYIITEELSNNTIENVLCSLVVFERKFSLRNIDRLIVVSSPFHIQRINLILSRYMPRWIKYSYCYSNKNCMSKENWVKNKMSRNRAKREAKGIIFYARNGYIDDKEINIS